MRSSASRYAVLTATLTLTALLLTHAQGAAGQAGAGQAGAAPAQAKPKSQAQVDRESAGSTPADPGPPATDLSAKLDSQAIRRAMVKVADWQLRESEAKFNRQWTYSTLYDGLFAASATTGDPKYRDAVAKAAADKWHYELITDRLPHADDFALGKSYEALYIQHPDQATTAATVAWANRLLQRQTFDVGAPLDPVRNPSNIVWWWCDALYMAPPVLARLSRLTHDQRYLDYMDKQWWTTSALLYDGQNHLYTRDASYLKKTEANGQKLFWSRGNGWVLAGLVQVLNDMPADYPSRAKYEQQFHDIAVRVAALQGADGLWRTGLLDQAAYKEPEVSGSAFYVYAMTWGVRTGRLPAKDFLPVITRGWAGMLTHVYADGRLGAIQPIGAAPDAVGPSSSYVYGVGGFLLAGSELDRMVSASDAAPKK